METPEEPNETKQFSSSPYRLRKSGSCVREICNSGGAVSSNAHCASSDLTCCPLVIIVAN